MCGRIVFDRFNVVIPKTLETNWLCFYRLDCVIMGTHCCDLCILWKRHLFDRCTVDRSNFRSRLGQIGMGGIGWVSLDSVEFCLHGLGLMTLDLVGLHWVEVDCAGLHSVAIGLNAARL